MTELISWTRPGWDGAEPGAFAVVIGVSRYDHLTGGPGAAAPESYGLGQLAVCASTAYRFFEWLRDKYSYDGVSLAKCWLLLSPAGEESAVETAIADHPPATFDNCELAVGEWFSTMAGLDPSIARASRSLFFFSGHGLELHTGEQLLLPADYLRPPANNTNRAMSTRNLCDGMAGLGVPSQLFFLDACRNDHSRFRERGVQLRGTPILNEDGTNRANGDVVSTVLYATATGAQAFGPVDVRDGGLSLYGKALLEGVGEPPAEICVTDQDASSVDLYRLLDYLGRRVAELLAEYGSTTTQPVTLSGMNRYPIFVADVEGTAKVGRMPPPTTATRQRMLRTRTALPSTDFGMLQGGTRSIDAFGGHAMGKLWGGHTLRTVDGAAVQHELLSVARSGTDAYQLLVRVPDAGKPMSLRMVDGDSSYTCLLPEFGPKAVVRLDIETTDGGGWYLSVTPDPASPGMIGQAAACWQRYLEGDVSGIRGDLDRLMDRVLAGESPSPYPALVVELVRARVDRGSSSPDRLRKLSLWYPSWFDFRVLWCELELRSGVDDDGMMRAARTLSRGFALPYAAETLGYAAQLFLRGAVPRAPAAEAADLVESAVDMLQPGGFLCVMRQDSPRRGEPGGGPALGQ